VPDCAADALENDMSARRFWAEGVEGAAWMAEGRALRGEDGGTYSHAKGAAEITESYPWARIP
jgi:hypothetical protein